MVVAQPTEFGRLFEKMSDKSINPENDTVSDDMLAANCVSDYSQGMS